MRVLGMMVVLMAAACGPKLIRSDSGWALEGRGYAVTALPDGRIMGDGWLLQNYDKVDLKQLRQREESLIDMSYGRSEDDGYLELMVITEVEAKSLRTLSERFVTAFRHQKKSVSVGGWTGSWTVDYPVTVLAQAGLGAGQLEGHETVLEQRHPDERSPFRSIYLSLVRPKGSKEMITVMYANSPAAFLSGLDDARRLVRRLKLGDHKLPDELKPFDAPLPSGFEPAPSDTTRL